MAVSTGISQNRHYLHQETPEATLRAITKRQVDISTIQALETEPITWPGREMMVQIEIA
jgi:hypothetical protein